MQSGTATHVRDSGLLLYDISHYGIFLEVSDTGTNITGHTEISASMLESAAELVFELSSELEVDSISLGDIEISSWKHDSDLIRISTQLPLQVTQQLCASVWYHGDPGTSNAYRGISNRTDPVWGSRVTYTLSEPFSALDWFVCKQVLHDKADSSDVFITVDEGLMAGSNGVLAGIDSLPGGKVRFHWKSGHTIAYYLLSLAVADYQDYSFHTHEYNGMDSIHVVNFVYDVPGYLEANREHIDETGDMIRLYSGLFSDYPYRDEKYGHCLAPMGGGMEHQTMTTLSSFHFTLVAHELAHQWFGDNVTCASWQDIWINEGFASYSEYLALEALESHAAAGDWMNNAHDWALREPEGSVYIPFEDAGNVNRIFSRSLSYKKGAALLHMIRYELGEDSLFFGTLSRFQELFADSVATGMDFLGVLNEVSGRDFSWFFDQWYFGKGFPHFRLTWWQTADSLSIDIEQSGSSEETPFFRTGLDLGLQFEEGGDSLIRIECTEPSLRVGIPLSKRVNDLHPDPANRVLNTSEVSTKTLSQGYLSVNPNPFGDELKVVFQTGTGKREILLTDLSGKVLDQQESTADMVRFDTRTLRQGLYLLQVREGTTRYSAKVVRH
jgi:aminopeptidase N